VPRVRRTVLLVDDVADVRVVVRHGLKLHGGFEVVAEASTGAEAIALSGALQPDIVVLDLGLPDLAGQEVLSGLRAAAPGTQVVVFTGSDNEADSVSGLVEGVALKTQHVDSLLALVATLPDSVATPSRLEVRAGPGQVAAARRFVARRCRALGCHHEIENAVLIASELVTNALIHAHTGCVVQVAANDQRLRIEVWDSVEGTPDPKSPRPDEASGRGLMLISTLCVGWGVQTNTAGGKTVWAEMHCEAPAISGASS
jgi:CheY-like chemotaxis protein